MTCTEMERLLDIKEPDAQARMDMQRHAEECPHCRMLLELRTLDRDETVPEEAHTRWQAAIRAEKARAENGPKKRGTSALRWLMPVCAAAAVLVATVALRKPITSVNVASVTAAPAAKQAMATVPAEMNGMMLASTTMPTPLATSQPVPAATVQMTATAQPAATVQMAATALPVAPAAEAVSMARPMLMAEEAAPAEAAMEESAMDAAVPDDVPEEAEWMADDMYAPDDFVEDEAEVTDEDVEILADDSAAASGSEDETPLFRWTVSDPTAACLRIQDALGQAGIDQGSMSADTTQATLQLNVNPDEWPALMAAMEAEGYQPAAEDARREAASPMTVTLYLEKEEP